MLPNKLSQDKPQFPSFIIDENAKPICTVISVGKNMDTKLEIIKRWNNYKKLKFALITVSSVLVAVTFTLILLIRFTLLS
jgi:hypothetical protein